MVVEKKAAAYLHADWWISRLRNSHSGEEIPIEIFEFFSFSRQTTMVQPIAGPNQPKKARRPTRCSACGHVGHNRSSRKCPMYANSNPNALPAASDSPYEDERVAKQTKVIRCVFDLETTGLSRKKDDIVKISAQLIIDKQVLSMGLFHELVKPGIKIPMDASAIHGMCQFRLLDRIG